MPFSLQIAQTFHMKLCHFYDVIYWLLVSHEYILEIILGTIQFFYCIFQKYWRNQRKKDGFRYFFWHNVHEWFFRVAANPARATMTIKIIVLL